MSPSLYNHSHRMDYIQEGEAGASLRADFGTRSHSQPPRRRHSASADRSAHESGMPKRNASFSDLHSANARSRICRHPPVPPIPLTSPSVSRRPSMRDHSRAPSVRIRGSFSSMKSTMSNADLGDMRNEVMVNYLYQQQCTNLWVAESAGATEGCILRRDQGDYTTCPHTLQHSSFHKSMMILNVQVWRVIMNIYEVR